MEILLQALQYCETLADFVAQKYAAYHAMFIQDLLNFATYLRAYCTHACAGDQTISSGTKVTGKLFGIDLLERLWRVSM